MTEPKFMTPAHRRAYLTHLNRCKAMDSYHRALIYTLTAVPALRNNIESCFGFERDEIKPESLAAGWQTTGTTKLTRFAYNLWNGYDDKSCTPYELFDCSFAPYMSTLCALRPSSTCSRWCLTSCAARSMLTGTATRRPFLPIFWSSLRRKSATNSARSLSLIRATTTTSTACPPRSTRTFRRSSAVRWPV